jgi:hypothetical protein
MRASRARGRFCRVAVPGFLFFVFAGSFAQPTRGDILSLDPYTGGEVATLQIVPNFTVDETVPFSTGTLNGQPLNLFCVDLSDAVLPGTYDSTTWNHDGIVLGSAVPNAGNIAWLIDNFAASTPPNSEARLGLQALIWDVEFGYSLVAPGIGSNTTPGTYAAYTNFLNEYTNDGSPAESLPTASIYWITPNDSGNPNDYQGLAGNFAVTPEPCSLLLFGLGTVGLIPLASFRRKGI